MKTVKLAAPGGLDRLSLVEPPDPGLGEIRVRIRASSLNFHDLGVDLGRVGATDGRIPMSDGAGEVEAVGEGVGEFRPGDIVVSGFFPFWRDGEPEAADFSGLPGDGVDGDAREAVVAPASHFTHAPRGYSAAEAATLTTAGPTAWRALAVSGGCKAGDVVLALGTGGVSIFALQLAKAMGASVIVTSSSDEKLDRARALGADFTLNCKQTPDGGRAVGELAAGRGVDHVIEVGGPGTLAQSIEACRVGGHIALIGVLPCRGGEVPTGLLMRRQQRLQGLIVGNRRQQQDFVRALEATGVRPVIGRSFPLAEIGQAFAHRQAQAHFAKIGLAI